MVSRCLAYAAGADGDWPALLLTHRMACEETVETLQERQSRRQEKWEKKIAVREQRATEAAAGAGHPQGSFTGAAVAGSAGNIPMAQAPTSAAQSPFAMDIDPDASMSSLEWSDVEISHQRQHQQQEQQQQRQPGSVASAGSAGAAGAGALEYKRSLLFRGLRVRMSVATGLVDTVRMHSITQRAEYTGDVLKKVQAVAEAPHGGQVGWVAGVVVGLSERSVVGMGTGFMNQ
jgi:hypothetical protein